VSTIILSQLKLSLKQILDDIGSMQSTQCQSVNSLLCSLCPAFMNHLTMLNLLI
jgi:hypothetical protein